MRTDVTFDRPIPAKLMVQLDNGETFEATAEHLKAFGVADVDTVSRRYREWIRRVHPEVRLDQSPLFLFAVVLDYVAGYDEMPLPETDQDARVLLNAALTHHLFHDHEYRLAAGEDPVALHEALHDNRAGLDHDRRDLNLPTRAPETA